MKKKNLVGLTPGHKLYLHEDRLWQEYEFALQHTSENLDQWIKQQELINATILIQEKNYSVIFIKYLTSEESEDQTSLD